MTRDAEQDRNDVSLIVPLESKQADRERLGRVFLLQWDYQETQRARRFLVHVLATLGVVLWIVSRWPGIVTAEVESTISALWVPCLAGTAAVAVLEMIFYRRRQQCLSEFVSTESPNS
jgi:hypothetical protein